MCSQLHLGPLFKEARRSNALVISFAVRNWSNSLIQTRPPLLLIRLALLRRPRSKQARLLQVSETESSFHHSQTPRRRTAAHLLLQIFPKNDDPAFRVNTSPIDDYCGRCQPNLPKDLLTLVVETNIISPNTVIFFDIFRPICT